MSGGGKSGSIIVESGLVDAKRVGWGWVCWQFLWQPPPAVYRDYYVLRGRFNHFLNQRSAFRLPVAAVLPYPVQVRNSSQVVMCAAVYLSHPVNLGNCLKESVRFCFSLPTLNPARNYDGREKAVVSEVERWKLYANNSDDSHNLVRRQILRRILYECSSTGPRERNLSDFITQGVLGCLDPSQQCALICEIKVETGKVSDRYVYTAPGSEDRDNYELILFANPDPENNGVRLQLNSGGPLTDDLETAMTTFEDTNNVFKNPSTSPKNERAVQVEYYQAEGIDGVEKLGKLPIKMRVKKGTYNVEVRQSHSDVVIETHSYGGPAVGSNLVMHYKYAASSSNIRFIPKLKAKLEILTNMADKMADMLKALGQTTDVASRVQFMHEWQSEYTFSAYKFTNPPVVRREGVIYRPNAYDNKESSTTKLVDAILFGLGCKDGIADNAGGASQEDVLWRYKDESVKVHAVSSHRYSVLESMNAYYSSYVKNDAKHQVFVYVHGSQTVTFSKLRVERDQPLRSQPQDLKRPHLPAAFLAIEKSEKWELNGLLSVQQYAEDCINKCTNVSQAQQ